MKKDAERKTSAKERAISQEFTDQLKAKAERNWEEFSSAFDDIEEAYKAASAYEKRD